MDIFKIGIFMLGLASIIIATTILTAYITSRNTEEAGFWAYCQENTIIIHANQNINNITISNKSGTICTINNIPKNSEDICYVSEGVYIVKTLNLNKVVVCKNITN